MPDTPNSGYNNAEVAASLQFPQGFPENRWRNRIVGFGYEGPEQLLANPFNMRIHTRYQQEAMEGLLDEVGWIQVVMVNVRTQHMVDGHMRVELALRHGELAVPVIYVDLDPEEEKLAIATLDPIAGLAVIDNAKLNEVLSEITAGHEGLQQFLAELAKQNPVRLQFQVDSAVPEGEEEPYDPATLPESAVRMVQLFLTNETFPEFMALAERLSNLYGTPTLTDTVFEAMKRAEEAAQDAAV